MQVIVYTTHTSFYSKSLKQYLASKGINFIEKLIDQNEQAAKEMAIYTQGYRGIPYTVIKKDDNTFVGVVGFDKGKIDQAIQ